MEDRFKFRAWDQKSEYMISWEELQKHGFDLFGYALDDDFVFVMQCTGLSAKSSHRGDKTEDLLIFESDVCKIVFSDDIFPDSEVILIGEVKYCQGVYMFLNNNTGGFYNLSSGTRTIEIIGTIHTHPELLEKGR